MNEQLLILISAGLASNLVLDHMLGVDPILAVSSRVEPGLKLSLLMLLVSPFTITCTYLLNTYLLVPLDLIWLQTVSMVLLISLLVLLAGWLTALLRPALYKQLELFIPLVLVNCSILGVSMLGIAHRYNLLESLFFGLGSALGFGLVMLLIAAIRERITVADVPIRFQGAAILLITLGLMSMAFMGFNGFGRFR